MPRFNHPVIPGLHLRRIQKPQICKALFEMYSTLKTETMATVSLVNISRLGYLQTLAGVYTNTTSSDFTERKPSVI